MKYKDFEIKCENESAQRMYQVIDTLPDGRRDVTHYATFGTAAAYVLQRARLRDEYEAMRRRDGLHVCRFSDDPERWWESRDYTRDVATTAWKQIQQSAVLAYGSQGLTGVVPSWGVSKKQYLRWRDMPALALHVQGFEHTGWVIISLNEGADVYEVELADERFIRKPGSRQEEVYSDSLASVIDTLVETGGLSQEEYHAKIKAAHPMECWAKEHGVQVVYL